MSTNPRDAANTEHPTAIGKLWQRDPTYEQLMSANLEFAMSEGSLFLDGRGRVQETLRRLSARLDELGIEYAVSGGMALFLHGYRRYTDDVAILVTSEALDRIHEQLDGRGYRRPFERSKNLRDTDSKVKIEFLVTGQFPGDGKPKAIAFPNARDVAEVRNGVKVLNLPTLITLKLASGMSGAGRGKDLGDVEELIKVLHLHVDVASTLHPDVRDKYTELWRGIHREQKRYVMLWPSEPLIAHAQSIEDVVASLKAAKEQLERMQADGVYLDVKPGTSNNYAYLVTTDPAVANKYGFEDESELRSETKSDALKGPGSAGVDSDPPDGQ